jgi:hypothetical protein
MTIAAEERSKNARFEMTLGPFFFAIGPFFRILGKKR